MQRALESMVRSAVRDLGEHDHATGLFTALGCGVAVSMPVLRTFIGFPSSDGPGVVIAFALGLLAFVCTTAGAYVAVRARTTGLAVLWAFASNVLPPTLVCAPTILGLIYSVPSGLAAFVFVLPFVLVARWSLARARSGYASRDLLIGATIATLSTLGLAVFEHADIQTYIPRSPLMLVPALIAGVTALALALVSLLGDARRAFVGRALARGRVEGFRMVREGGEAIVEEVVALGAGPHRAAFSTETLGTLPISIVRVALATMIVLVALTGVASLALHA